MALALELTNIQELSRYLGTVAESLQIISSSEHAYSTELIAHYKKIKALLEKAEDISKNLARINAYIELIAEDLKNQKTLDVEKLSYNVNKLNYYLKLLKEAQEILKNDQTFSEKPAYKIPAILGSATIVYTKLQLAKQEIIDLEEISTSEICVPRDDLLSRHEISMLRLEEEELTGTKKEVVKLEPFSINVNKLDNESLETYFDDFERLLNANRYPEKPEDVKAKVLLANLANYKAVVKTLKNFHKLLDIKEWKLGAKQPNQWVEKFKILAIDAMIEERLTECLIKRKKFFSSCFFHDLRNGTKNKNETIKKIDDIFGLLLLDHRLKGDNKYKNEKYIIILDAINSNLKNPELEGELRKNLLAIKNDIMGMLRKYGCPQPIMTQLAIFHLVHQPHETFSEFQEFLLDETGFVQHESNPEAQPQSLVKKRAYIERIPFLNKLFNQVRNVYHFLGHRSLKLEYQKVAPKDLNIKIGAVNDVVNNLINKIYSTGVDIIGAKISNKVNNKLNEIAIKSGNEIEDFRKKYVAILFPLKEGCDNVFKGISLVLDDNGFVDSKKEEEINTSFIHLMSLYKTYILNCIALCKGPEGFASTQTWKNEKITNSLLHSILEYQRRLELLEQYPLSATQKELLKNTIIEVNRVVSHNFRKKNSTLEREVDEGEAVRVQDMQSENKKFILEAKINEMENEKLYKSYQSLQGNILKIFLELKNDKYFAAENFDLSGIIKKIPLSEKIPLASNLLSYVDDKITDLVKESEEEIRLIKKGNAENEIINNINDINVRAGQLAAQALTIFSDIIEANKDKLDSYEAIKLAIIDPYLDCFREAVGAVSQPTPLKFEQHLMTAIIENDNFKKYKFVFKGENDAVYKCYQKGRQVGGDGYIILPFYPSSSLTHLGPITDPLSLARLNSHGIKYNDLKAQDALQDDVRQNAVDKLDKDFKEFFSKYVQNSNNIEKMNSAMCELIKKLKDRGECKNNGDLDLIMKEAAELLSSTGKSIEKANNGKIKAVKFLNELLFEASNSELIG
jgi:hypothetical protein